MNLVHLFIAYLSCFCFFVSLLFFSVCSFASSYPMLTFQTFLTFSLILLCILKIIVLISFAVAPDTINNHVKTCTEEQKNLHFFAPEYGGRFSLITDISNLYL